MLRQLSDDACDSVAPEWGCNPFSSDSTVFNANRIASVTAALMLTLGVNGPQQVSLSKSLPVVNYKRSLRCKWTLNNLGGGDEEVKPLSFT